MRRTALPASLALRAAPAALLWMVSASGAMAADSPWTVTPAANGQATMSRTVAGVALQYSAVPGDSDKLSISVADCSGTGGSWSMSESLDRRLAEDARAALHELAHNAALNCKVPDDLEPRLLDGFDAAFDKVRPTAPPHVATVAGWTLEDKGSHPGDDSDRVVQMSRALPTVSIVYHPGENGEGASFELKFTPCQGGTYMTGFDFGNPPQDHAKVVQGEVAEAYADFAAKCPKGAETQATLMEGFDQALQTLEQWLKDKPFTYPPEPQEQQPGTDAPGGDDTSTKT